MQYKISFDKKKVVLVTKSLSTCESLTEKTIENESQERYPIELYVLWVRLSGSGSHCHHYCHLLCQSSGPEQDLASDRCLVTGFKLISFLSFCRMSDLPASLPHEESVANDLISDEYVHEPSAVDSSTVSALVSATPKPKRSPQTQQLPQTLPYSLTIESQDMKLTGGFHLQNEAGQPDGIAFIKTPVVKVTGEFASVPPGIYWPLYKVKWDPEASSLEHVLFSAMVVKSNLDLLLYATDGSVRIVLCAR